MSTSLLLIIAGAVRLFAAAILIEAAWHKLANRLEFQGVLAAYKILPKGIEQAASFALPVVEGIAALGLLSAPHLGAPVAAALFASYAVAIAINLKRGRHHIDCGCGGASTPLSPALVWRNLLLVALVSSIPVALNNSPLSGTATGALLSVVFALGLGALYLSFNQLLSNAGIYRRLWLGERVR